MDKMRVSFARMSLDFYLSQADISIHAVELKVLDLDQYPYFFVNSVK